MIRFVFCLGGWFCFAWVDSFGWFCLGAVIWFDFVVRIDCFVVWDAGGLFCLTFDFMLLIGFNVWC